MWYELVIKSWRDFTDIERFICGNTIPRVGEFIENYRVIDEDNNFEYRLTLKVEKVSHSLITDKKSWSIVYGTVIKDEFIREVK